jgi:hypothetical protein
LAYAFGRKRHVVVQTVNIQSTAGAVLPWVVRDEQPRFVLRRIDELKGLTLSQGCTSFSLRDIQPDLNAGAVVFFYNRQRRHQWPDYLTSVDYERSMVVA